MYELKEQILGIRAKIIFGVRTARVFELIGHLPYNATNVPGKESLNSFRLRIVAVFFGVRAVVKFHAAILFLTQENVVSLL